MKRVSTCFILLILALSIGCQNKVCRQAADHVLDCVRTNCEGSEHAYCENVDSLERQLAGQLNCDEENQRESQEWLGQSCETVVNEFFGEETDEIATEEEEGETEGETEEETEEETEGE
jgi:hypothetical protein